MTELPPLPEPDAWTTRIDIDWAKKNAGRAGSFYAKKSDPNDIGMYTAETVQRLMAEHAAEAVRVALDDAAATLAQAVCDDCENGVQWLNIAASAKFSKDYPHLRAAINALASRT